VKSKKTFEHLSDLMEMLPFSIFSTGLVALLMRWIRHGFTCNRSYLSVTIMVFFSWLARFWFVNQVRKSIIWQLLSLSYTCRLQAEKSKENRKAFDKRKAFWAWVIKSGTTSLTGFFVIV